MDPDRERALRGLEQGRRNRAAAKAARSQLAAGRVSSTAHDGTEANGSRAPAPAAPLASRARVRIRSSGARPVVVEMDANATLEDLYHEASRRLAEQDVRGPFTMTSTASNPHRLFDEAEYQQPLHALGLVPSAAIIMGEADTAPFAAGQAGGTASSARTDDAAGGQGGGLLSSVASWTGFSWLLGGDTSDNGSTGAGASDAGPAGSGSAFDRDAASRSSAHNSAGSRASSSRVTRRAGFGRNVHGLNTSGDSGGADGREGNEFFGGDSTAYIGRPEGGE